VSAIVGFDTATAVTAVAATTGGELAWEAAREPAATARPLHVAALMADVEQAVQALGGWTRTGRIAVGVGPGSFTGLRVGIATARALAQATGLDLVGVGSLAALAAGMEGLAGTESRSRLAVFDARRGELFAALFGSSGREDWAPFVARPEELAERVRTLIEPPVAAGDGSIRFRAILESANVEVPPDSDPVHRISARWICSLASGMRAGEAPAEPLYLRRPDAELWREQQARHRNAPDEQA
jgi:tRNA threonylcarbamoyladenosine biosynthesis protein TsaB